jgi:hypothetical protein
MSQLVQLSVLLCLCGCDRSASVTSLDDQGPLAESLRQADQVQLYEGLPHQNFEPKVLKAELESNKTVDFGDFPFYAAPQELASDDRSTLTKLIGDADSFSPMDLTAAKACGGFHPDYCLVWKVGTDSYYALLCFGCGEIKAKGSELQLHSDIRNAAQDKFEETLKSYRNNRPLSPLEMTEN